MTLLTTDFLAANPETFAQMRQVFSDLGLFQGVVGQSDYLVTQHGTGNMSVDVAAGGAWVKGNNNVRQGHYHQINDASINVSLGASDPTNPRVDQIFLRVTDSAYVGSGSPSLVVVQGTATAGAQVTSPSGTGYRAGAVSDAAVNTAIGLNWMRLSDVAVRAGSTSILTADIQDRRQHAFRRSIAVGATGSTGALGSAFQTVPGTGNLIEVAPGQAVLACGQAYATSVAATGAILSHWTLLDGAGVAAYGLEGLAMGVVMGAAGNMTIPISARLVPATPGLCLVKVEAWSSANAGTVSGASQQYTHGYVEIVNAGS